MAGGFESGHADEPISAINITPLVDVVLVLLVIFLMTAPVLYQSAIKVQLPKAATGESAEKTPFNFTITREGQVLWDKETMDWSAIAKRLTSLGEKVFEQTAIISADESTPHGAVIRLMDTLRQAGLTRFALNVDAPAHAPSRPHP